MKKMFKALLFPIWLVLVVADPDHRQVIAGIAGEPAVAAVVAGTGLAGRRAVVR